jgi:hypothetical protein
LSPGWYQPLLLSLAAFVEIAALGVVLAGYSSSFGSSSARRRTLSRDVEPYFFRSMDANSTS